MQARMVNLKVRPGDVDVNDRDVLMAQLAKVDPAIGLTITDIEKRLALRTSLRNAGESWLLNDEDWAMLKAGLESERWIILSAELVAFVREFGQAELVDVDAGLRLVRSSE